MRTKDYRLIRYSILLICLLGAANIRVQAQEQGNYDLEIQINFIRNWGNSACDSEFAVYHVKNGNEQNFRYWSDGSWGEHEIRYNIPSIAQVFPIHARPDYIRFYGKRAWKQGLLGKCKWGRDGGDTHGIDYSRPNINDVFSLGDRGEELFGGYESTVRLIIQPLNIKIWYFDSDGQQGSSNEKNILPDKDNITLKATKGFIASTYKWQYSTNNYTWKDFPANVQYRDNKSEVTFKGTDLFSEEEFRDLIGKKNISIRVNSPTKEGIKTFTLYPNFAAPHITKVDYEMETCYNSADATVQISLDRALYPGEVLYLQKNGQIEQGQGPLVPDAANIVRIPDWEAGTYQLSFRATYNGSELYVGDPTHKHTLTIDHRPPMNHSIVSIKQVSCHNGSDAEIKLNATGGNGQYIGRLFEQGQTTALQSINFTAAAPGVISRIKRGTYRIEVYDTNGCTAYQSNGSVLTHTVEIIEPLQPVDVQLEHMVSPLAFASSDGETTIRVSGGTQSPSGYTIIWRSEQGESYTPESSSRDGEAMFYTVKGLHRGNYYITVEDKNFASLAPQDKEIPCGCTDTLSYYLSAPPLLEVTIEKTNFVHCNGSNEGELVAHAKGGVPLSPGLPYIYTWYRYAESAPQEIQMPNDSILDGLIAGKYQVKITDANKITVLSDPFIMTEPDSLKIRFEAHNIGCADSETGKIEAFVTGGTPPYKYQWNREGETTNEIEALEAGMYILRVTDKNNCQLTATTEVKAPGNLEVDSLVVQPSCLEPQGGLIELKLSGATPPYKVLWADNQSTELVRKGLSPGDYFVAVTDGNGCSSSFKFTLHKLKEFTVDLGPDLTMCRDQKRVIKAVCEEPDVTYEWYADDKKLDATESELTIDKAATYRVKAINPQGCFAEDEINITMSRETLPLDFTVPTVTAVNSDIHAVNISTVTADKIEWHFPKEALIVKQSDIESVFSIREKGTYAISMEGFSGGCSTIITRSIKVVGKDEVDLPDDKLPLIKQFIVTPNPTTGYFKVLIELSRAEDFTMLLYAPSGYLMDKKEVKQTQNKVFEYEINGSTVGTYLLHLQTSTDKSVLKVVVNR